MSGIQNAAFADGFLLRVGPAAGDALAREVNDGLEPGDAFRRQWSERVPGDLVCISGWPSHQSHDMGVARLKRGQQRRPNWP